MHLVLFLKAFRLLSTRFYTHFVVPYMSDFILLIF